MWPVNPPDAEKIPVKTVLHRSAALWVLVSAGAAMAQPGGSDRPLDDAERVLPRVMRTERVVMPTRERAADPVAPGLTGGKDWADPGDAPAKLPEGTFVIERPGRVIPAPGGRKVFVPEIDAREPGEGPMLLLPSGALERLEVTLGDATGPVRVSGEVFVYRGRRHLLATSFLMGGVPEPTAEPVTPAGGTEETGAGEGDDEPASLLDDPDVRGLLDELAEEAPPRPAERPGSAGGSTEDAGIGLAPAPDGTPIVRRRGRLVRSGDGAWMFVFDNDTEDRLAARSLVVLPCLLLERIEREAQTRGDSAEMVLSGRVHTHRGVGYLMPTMMLRVTTTDIVPGR